MYDDDYGHDVKMNRTEFDIIVIFRVLRAAGDKLGYFF